jgi:phosphonoacetaldehyde hydrolase
MIARYRGPLKAVILDWAGTTVDFGCHAPVAVLRELFEGEGVGITDEEVRRHMGLLKKDHIRAILEGPRVAAAWTARRGAPPDEGDVQRLFESFLPRQIARLGECSDVIPGVPEAVAEIRARGLRIGSTTGYTRAMLEPVLQRAAGQGYQPDASVTPDEAGAGRPAPWMCFLNLMRLDVFPPAACVKIGDTPADMQEGLNAGMWTVGVIDSSNEVGLSLAEWQKLDENTRQELRESARRRLLDAGAHFTVESLAHAGSVFDQIERELAT